MKKQVCAVMSALAMMTAGSAVAADLSPIMLYPNPAVDMIMQKQTTMSLEEAQELMAELKPVVEELLAGFAENENPTIADVIAAAGMLQNSVDMQIALPEPYFSGGLALTFAGSELLHGYVSIGFGIGSIGLGIFDGQPNLVLNAGIGIGLPLIIPFPIFAGMVPYIWGQIAYYDGIDSEIAYGIIKLWGWTVGLVSYIHSEDSFSGNVNDLLNILGVLNFQTINGAEYTTLYIPLGLGALLGNAEVDAEDVSAKLPEIANLVRPYLGSPEKLNKAQESLAAEVQSLLLQ